MLIVITLITSSACAVSLLLRTVWSLRRFTYRPVGYQVTDLPSVSVCIAARNETHALAQCLERVLKSDYKKLEVLVLDDSSNDDTSLIIKSFAHAGVRFVAGTELAPGWLGKNHAYQTLIDEASGDYVLFLDVDTTIEETTVSQLVSQLLAHQKSMISVLPRREDGRHLSAMFGTMRYYWELLLAGRRAPPASSALWMVNRAKLDEVGIGLKNYGSSVRPERHLARQLQRTKDYYYLIGSRQLGVGYEKRLASQYETALRLYYPMTGRTVILWLVYSTFVTALVLPLFTLLFNLHRPDYAVWSLAIIFVIAFSFGLFTRRTYAAVAWQVRIIAGPLLAIQELILLLISYTKYLTGTVMWKGRPVQSKSGKSDAISLSEPRR